VEQEIATLHVLEIAQHNANPLEEMTIIVQVEHVDKVALPTSVYVVCFYSYILIRIFLITLVLKFMDMFYFYKKYSFKNLIIKMFKKIDYLDNLTSSIIHHHILFY
jgi:hypothetical protein